MNVSSLLAMSGSHSRNPLIKLVQGDRRRSFFWLLFRYTLFYPKICVQRRLLSNPILLISILVKTGGLWASLCRI